MERILTAKEEVRESFRELILQPQSDIPHFRRFLGGIGWEIVEEEIVLEDGKFYPMMKAVRGEARTVPGDMPYTPEEAFGGLLLKKRHPVLKLYLERELRIRNEILEKLKEAAADDRRKEVEEERRLVLTALEQYESI